jgi:hypothetical protein
VGDQLALLVEHLALGGGDVAAGMDDGALGDECLPLGGRSPWVRIQVLVLVLVLVLVSPAG